MPTGRPCEFTQETADAICARLSEGESLTSICKDAAMPARCTVTEWVRRFPEFAKQYEQARTLMYEKWADETVDIADDATNDYVKRETEKGGAELVCDHEHINRSRLRVDTRKWLLSKLLPKTYGDRTELTGPGGAPLTVQIVKFGEKESQ